jgi:hypothetical protein
MPKATRIRTTDGYTFARQPDGSWDDGDMQFDSLADVADENVFEVLEWEDGGAFHGTPVIPADWEQDEVVDTEGGVLLVHSRFPMDDDDYSVFAWHPAAALRISGTMRLIDLSDILVQAFDKQTFAGDGPHQVAFRLPDGRVIGQHST